jgi:hypothetical protein
MKHHTRISGRLASLAAQLRPRLWWMGPAVAVAIGLYYGIGGWMVHTIDADPTFAGPPSSARQSRAAATAAALILREVDVHVWTANDPFFQPGWVLSDMPRYQEGIIAATERFAASMAERQGDPTGPSFDGDLRLAAGLLKYPGTVWKFASSTSWLPTASAEKQYRRAARTFQAYNTRLDEGVHSFDRSPEALAATLTDIAADLGTLSGAIEGGIGEGGGHAVFNGARGRLYAYSLLLRDLGTDHAQVIADRNLSEKWRRLLDSLHTVVAVDPWLVINAAPGSTVLANHLVVQGFYLLRVRQQLTDLAATLRAR